MVSSYPSPERALVELIKRIDEGRRSLRNSYASVDELLNRLHNLDNIVRRLDQYPSQAMKDVLRSLVVALTADELLKNDDLNVKVSVASIICEIARITAPEQPNDDAKMRESFKVLITIFGELSSMDERNYAKTSLTLETFEKCQLYMLMWDLDDALVVELFQQFLDAPQIPRANLPASVISYMEKIMTSILKFDDEVPDELFSILLRSLRRENKNVSPLSYSMAERVFSECAVELKIRLPTAMRLTDIAFNDYAEIVARVCNDAENFGSDGRTGEVGPSESAPSESLMNDDNASTRDDDNLENVNSTETLNSLEIQPQNVSSTEVDICPISDELQAVQGMESEPDLPTNTNDNSVKDLSSLGMLRVCDATQCPQTEDPDAANTVQEELNAEPVSALEKAEESSKDSNSRTDAQPLDSQAALVHRQLDPVFITGKRGRKPNSLIKPEEGYDNALFYGGKKSPVRRYYRRQIGRSSKKTVSKSSSSPPEVEEDVQLLSAPETRSRSFPSRKRSKKRNLRKEESMLIENDGSGSSSVSAMDVAITPSQEKANLEHGKSPVVTGTSDGCIKNPEEREGSPVAVVAKKQKKGIAISEHLQKASGLKTSTSLATPEASTQEIDRSIKAKGKRKKTSLMAEVSDLAQAVQENGESLVGRKIQVYWPMDKTFYRGCVTSFDTATKNYKVTYDDGEEEVLDLKKEKWELIEDNVSSDRGQASGTAASAKKKKKKVSSAVSNEPVSKSKCKKLKIFRSKLESEKGKSIELPTDTTTKMDSPCPKLSGDTSSKSLQDVKVDTPEPSKSLQDVKVDTPEPIKASPSFAQVGETVDVHGYLVKPRSAPILQAIIAKYGDIASSCPFKSQIVKSHLLEVVCDVVEKFKSLPLTLSGIKKMICEISDAADAKIEVSWIQQYLVQVFEEAQAAMRSSEVITNSYFLREEMQKKIKEKQVKLRFAQEELTEAEKSAEAMNYVIEKIENDSTDSVIEEKSWLKRFDDLL